MGRITQHTGTLLGLLVSCCLAFGVGAQKMPDLPVRESEAQGVRVTVVDEKGARLAGMDVLVMPTGEEIRKRATEWRREKSKTMNEAELQEAFARKFYKRYRTDAKGEVVVAVGGVVIAMRDGTPSEAGDLTGDPVQIVWTAPIKLQVHVVGPRGKPAAGLGLTVDRANSPFRFSRRATRTDRAGVASLVVPRHLAQQRRLAVTAQMLARKPVQFVFDPREADKIPARIELKLPDYGQVRVYAYDPQSGTAPKVQSGELTMREINRMSRDQVRIWADRNDGDNVTFSFVGVGLDLAATLHTEESKDPFAVNGKGPTRHREMVVLTHEAVKPAPSLRMRVLGLDGKPLVREQIYVVFSKPGRYSYDRARTDQDGRLKVIVPARYVDGRMNLVRRSGESWSDPTGYLGSYRLDRVRTGGPAAGDLGVIRLTRAPVLVAGVVVDPAGRPVGGAFVRSDRVYFAQPVNGGFSGGGSGFLKHVAVTGADGKFEFRENGENPDEVLLQITKDGHALSGFGAKVPGRKPDVRVVLYRAARIEGTFKALPNGIEKWTGDVKLWPEDTDYSREIGARGAVLEKGGFWFRSVPAGRYQVGFFVKGNREPAHLVKGVEVTAEGVAKVGVLQGVDWSLFGSFHRLEVVDSEGVAIEDGLTVMQYFGKKSGGYSGSGVFRAKTGHYVAFMPPENAWIGVRGDKYQSVEIKPPFGDKKIVLKRKPKVVFKIANMPELEGLRLGIKIEAVARKLRSSAFGFGRSGDPRFVNPTTIEALLPTTGKFVLRFTVDVPLDANRFRLEQLEVHAFEVATDAGENVVEVELEAEQIRELKGWAKIVREHKKK